MEKNDISVARIIFSYFIGIIVFLIVEFLAVSIIELLWVFLYNIPIDFLRNLILRYLGVGISTPKWITSTVGTLLASGAAGEIIVLINKKSEIQQKKTLFGLGITLIIVGSVCLVRNFFMDSYLFGCITYIFSGIFFITENRRQKKNQD